MNAYPKNHSAGKKTRRGIAAFTAIVLVGLAGVAGAAMMALEQGTTNPLAADAAGTFDPLIGSFAPDGVVPDVSGVAAPGGAEPGADANQVCQSGADPSGVPINVCLNTAGPVYTWSSTYGHPDRCGSRNKGVYTSTSGFRNAPAAANYGTAGASLTQFKGSTYTSFSESCIVEACCGQRVYAYQSNSGTVAGKTTKADAATGQLTVGTPVAPVTVSLVQTNTTGSNSGYLGSTYYCDGYQWCSSFNGYTYDSARNQDTKLEAKSDQGRVSVAQDDNQRQDAMNYQSYSRYGGYSGSENRQVVNKNTAASAFVPNIQGTTGVTSVSAGQWNYTYASSYCNPYCYSNTYGSKTTGAFVTTPGLGAAHSAGVYQSKAVGQGCKTYVVVDGVNYMPADQSACTTEAPDVPRVPEIPDFPVLPTI